MEKRYDDDFEIEPDDYENDLSKEFAKAVKDGIIPISQERKIEEKIIEEKPKGKNTKFLQDQMLKRLDPYTLCQEFFKDSPFYYDKNKIFWIWNKESYVWAMVDEIDVINAINESFDLSGITNSSLQNQILNGIKLLGRQYKPETNNTNLIQFGKKIYDIRTGEVFEANPRYFITNTIPFTPSISDDTPTFDLLFDSWVGRDNRELMYEIIAYCSYRDYPIHHLFCFVGSGSNGKSKYLKIIEKFLGLDNCCSTSLDTLMGSRFESANLYKKLVCMMGETNFGTLSKTDMLKKLTGQDLVSFEFKGKNPISDYNYAKILISTNTLPQTTDRTDGFYRRWVLIDFPNKFNGEFDILKTIPESEYCNLARKVLNILPNLLSYMRFTNVGTLEQRKKNYEDKSNPLPKFLELSIEHNSDSSISKWEFRERFNTYLKQNNLRSQSDTEIGISMKLLDYSDRRIMNADGKQVRFWDGIRWKDSNKLSAEEESIINAKPL